MFRTLNLTNRFLENLNRSVDGQWATGIEHALVRIVETVGATNVLIYFLSFYYPNPKAELSMDTKNVGVKNPEKRAKAAYVSTSSK